ncbi:hypothetical protein ABEB36_002719 [Hypothenemus hampei]|uniref:Uncharacterized protein n=1 Tax=Hypothenemus hampei TaxID=57062 RepID=A0ABD1F6V1_HYPHA
MRNSVPKRSCAGEASRSSLYELRRPNITEGKSLIHEVGALHIRADFKRPPSVTERKKEQTQIVFPDP